MPNGDGEGFVFDPGVFLGGILQTIAELVGALLSVIAGLVRALNQVFSVVFGDLGAVANFAVGDAQIHLGGLDLIFHTMLFGSVMRMWRDLLDFLKRHLAWLLHLRDWLAKLHRAQQQMMLRALREWLNLIQRLRQILLIFRLLHLKIAAQLDNYLARIEARITAAIFSVIRRQNLIVQYLTLLGDPTQIAAVRRTTAALAGVVQAIQVQTAGIDPETFLCVAKGGPLTAAPTFPWPSVVLEQHTHSGVWGGSADAWGTQLARFSDLLDQDLSTV